MLLKDYLTQNLGDEFDEYRFIDHLMPMKKWYQMIGKTDGQASFVNPNLRKPIADEPRGYITLKSFFDPKNVGGFYDGQPLAYVKNIKELIAKYGDWNVDSADRDNTYNQMGSIEDYVDYKLLHLSKQDDAHSADEGADLLLMRCGTSLDPRGNYTDYCGAIFDCDSIDHYNANSYLNRQFNVMNADLTVYNTKAGKYEYYTVSVDSCANDEMSMLNLDNVTSQCAATSDQELITDGQSLEMPGFDPDDMGDLIEFICDNYHLDKDKNRVSIHNIKFCSESI